MRKVIKAEKLDFHIPSDFNCTICGVTKMKALPHFPSKTVYKPGEYIVSNYKVYEHVSIDGYKGYFLYKDSCTGYAQIYLADSKAKPHFG
jgi:hypothetical protein